MVALTYHELFEAVGAPADTTGIEIDIDREDAYVSYRTMYRRDERVSAWAQSKLTEEVRKALVALLDRPGEQVRSVKITANVNEAVMIEYTHFFDADVLQKVEAIVRGQVE